MPKKFKGENTKAVEAKLRKADAKNVEDQKKKKAEEDEYWRDDDKNMNKKINRKEEALKKQEEKAQRKIENSKLLENEDAQLNPEKFNAAKITRAQAAEHAAKIQAEDRSKTQKLAINVTVNEDEIVENINRLTFDNEARSVTEALDVLSDGKVKVDMHPERRVKAAFAAFEEARMKTLKEENPNLRLSQLKQMIKKEWMKSPENPMNAALYS